jgi:hypothetical protein
MLGKSKLKKNTVDENPEKIDEINENVDKQKNVKPVKKTRNVQTKSKG